MMYVWRECSQWRLSLARRQQTCFSAVQALASFQRTLQLQAKSATRLLWIGNGACCSGLTIRRAISCHFVRHGSLTSWSINQLRLLLVTYQSRSTTGSLVFVARTATNVVRVHLLPQGQTSPGLFINTVIWYRELSNTSVLQQPELVMVDLILHAGISNQCRSRWLNLLQH